MTRLRYSLVVSFNLLREAELVLLQVGHLLLLFHDQGLDVLYIFSIVRPIDRGGRLTVRVLRRREGVRCDHPLSYLDFTRPACVLLTLGP